LRIIAGEYRGRKLKTLSGQQTRPTMDKIKESIFHRLGPFFSGGQCLDLFAGSGALGIEALSRGFERAVFIDRNRQAVKTIRQNLQLLQIPKERVIVWQLDALQALRRLGKMNDSFQMIFIDPPYYQINFSKLLTEIEQHRLLTGDGIIYCEHGADEKLTNQVGLLNQYQQISYGQTTSVSLYQYVKE